MWISLNWIKDFVDYQDDLTPTELGVLISLRVAEVEDPSPSSCSMMRSVVATDLI